MDKTELSAFFTEFARWLESIGYDAEPRDEREAVPMPWLLSDMSTAQAVESCCSQVIVNCKLLLEHTEQLLDKRTSSAEFDDMLLNISPFRFGLLGDLKRSILEFAALYHNIMNYFLTYMSPRDFREARQTPLFAPEANRGLPAGKLGPSMRLFQNRLTKKGTLESNELVSLAKSFSRTWQAARRIVTLAEDYQINVRRPIWLQFRILQICFLEMLASVVSLEPLWAVYEHSEPSWR